MSPRIKIAKTEAEIRACHPVMQELRPHLGAMEFEEQVKRLQALHGFQLAYLEDGEIMCVAGLRFGEWLPQGRYLEIEDLVTRADARAHGYGGLLFDWIVEYARSSNCVHVRLVSAVRREDAHRFYRRKGMGMLAYYFSMDL
jgi:GNAT superfamily N-acetyltransferase